MSEQQQGTEQPREVFPFPVRREAVERALGEIAEDAGKAMMQEAGTLQFQNPAISTLLHSRMQVLSDPIPYIEGALWTHRILRTQAELNGGQIPKVSHEGAGVWLKNCVDELTKKGRDVSLDDFSRELGENVIAEEPELGKAIKEMTKYRPSKENFYSGSADVYFVLKKLLEARVLQKKLGL